MADLLDKLMPLLEGIVDSSGQLNLTNLNVGALVPLLKGAIAQRGSGAKQPGQRRLTLIDPQATLYYYQMNCRAWPPGLIKAALDMMLAEPPPLMEGELNQEAFEGYNLRFEVKRRAMDTVLWFIQNALQRRRLSLLSGDAGEDGLRIYARWQGALDPAVVKESIDLCAHLREPGGGVAELGEYVALMYDFINLLVPNIRSLLHRQPQQQQLQAGP